jgi:flagellar assembly factor FliW
MNIETRDFGVVDISDESIYNFPNGIYGFESENQFALFSMPVDDITLIYLQSTQKTSPCFFVFEPWDVLPNYAPLISEEDLKEAEAATIDDLIFLSIATIPDSISEMSINIKSPVVLNPKTGKGFQVILLNPDYSVRYQPFIKKGV